MSEQIPIEQVQKTREAYFVSTYKYLKRKSSHGDPKQPCSGAQSPNMNLIQKYLSEQTGIGASTIEKIRRVRDHAGRNSLNKLRRVLGTGVTELNPYVLTREYFEGKTEVLAEDKIRNDLIERCESENPTLEDRRSLVLLDFWIYSKKRAHKNDKVDAFYFEFSWRAVYSLVASSCECNATTVDKVRKGTTDFSSDKVEKLKSLAPSASLDFQILKQQPQ